MPYIFSTLAAAVVFCGDQKGPDGVIETGKGIRIAGGHGVAVETDRLKLHTPHGVVTSVTDEEYDRLKDDFTFKRYVADGYMTVRAKEAPPEKVASDMNLNDGGQPLNESTLAKHNPDAKVTTA